MLDLQDRFGLTYLFIAHAWPWSGTSPIGLSYSISAGDGDRTGRRHLPAAVASYTRYLFRRAIPDAAVERQRTHVQPPASRRARSIAVGCRFAPVPDSQSGVRIKPPPLVQYATDHFAACHFPNQLS